MFRASTLVLCLLCLAMASCSHQAELVTLGGELLQGPVSVGKVDTYGDDRCLGLVLVGSRGTELLISVVREPQPMREGRAYRPFSEPCGSVFVGTLDAVLGTGTRLPDDAPEIPKLRAIVRESLARERRLAGRGVLGELPPSRQLPLEEALVLLGGGCEPSN